jgi:hypothetical protein
LNPHRHALAVEVVVARDRAAGLVKVSVFNLLWNPSTKRWVVYAMDAQPAVKKLFGHSTQIDC